MVLDASIHKRGLNLQDFDRLNEEFQLRKQSQLAQIERAKSGGQDPAALRLANEYEAAMKSGDTERANRLAAFAKIYDKNVTMTPDGQYVPLPGLPSALGNIEFGKESGTQQARDIYEPGRAGNVEAAKLEQQLGYGPRITSAEKTAQLEAEKAMDTSKKAGQDVSTLGAVSRAREVLPKATSGRLENILSSGARFFGKSTEKTQADAQLEIIGAELVSNVPRFEGPQSNIDVQFYREAAADVANPNKSVNDRLSALRAIEERIALRAAEGKLGGVDPVEESRRAILKQQGAMGGASPMQRDDLRGAIDYSEYFR